MLFMGVVNKQISQYLKIHFFISALGTGMKSSKAIKYIYNSDLQLVIILNEVHTPLSSYILNGAVR